MCASYFKDESISIPRSDTTLARVPTHLENLECQGMSGNFELSGMSGICQGILKFVREKIVRGNNNNYYHY